MLKSASVHDKPPPYDHEDLTPPQENNRAMGRDGGPSVARTGVPSHRESRALSLLVASGGSAFSCPCTQDVGAGPRDYKELPQGGCADSEFKPYLVQSRLKFEVDACSGDFSVSVRQKHFDLAGIGVKRIAVVTGSRLDSRPKLI
jgi:hypothetical protein